MKVLTPDERKRAIELLGGPEGVKKEAHKRRLYSNLHAFFVEAWPHIDPAEYVDNWHVPLITEKLEKVATQEIKRLLINVPPGSAKSSIVGVMFNAWVWLTRPAKSFIYVTHKLDVSRRDAEKCRTLMERDWYQELIPKRFGPKKNEPWHLDGRGIDRYLNSERGFRLSASVTGGITGDRADTVILDDPQAVDEFVTPETQERTWQFFTKTLSSRVNDLVNSPFVVIQQRVAEGDVAGRIIERDQEQKAANNARWTAYDLVRLPSEYNPDMHTAGDPRTTKGELLFPERFPDFVLAQTKIELGDAGYAAQHDQDPIAAGAGIFNLSRLKFWYDPLISIPAPHKEHDRDGNEAYCAQMMLPEEGEDSLWGGECMSFDLTFKKTTGSDFVAGAYFRLYNGTNAFLMDLIHERMGYVATREAIRAWSKKYPSCSAKYIELAANGDAIIDELKNEIWGLIPVKPEGGKVARANAIAPIVDAGQLVLPHPLQFPWVHKVLKEMRSFPRGKHDDIVDSISQGLPKLMEGDLNWLEGLCRL